MDYNNIYKATQQLTVMWCMGRQYFWMALRNTEATCTCSVL